MEFDVIVLGTGPGGEDAAGRLAEAGLRVAAVEANLVGGECPYWGCIPSKMMIRAADLLTEARRVPGVAGDSSVSPDWGQVAGRIRTEATDDWNDEVAAKRLTGKGVQLFRGQGKITARGEVTVNGQVLRAARGIVVATGSEPAVPPIEGLRRTPFWNNHDAIEAEQAPESLIVLGGGAIGAELAQVFSRFGTAVTVLESADRLLPPEEPEAGELLRKVFEAEGITVRTGAAARRVDHDGSVFTVETGEGPAVRAQRLLVATGRRSDLSALGVGAFGLDESARSIETDGRMRAAEGLWALGDVTGKGAFTHVSMYQANIVVHDILGEPVHDAEYHAVPRVTFTDPEIGSVGLSQAQAEQRGLRVRTALTRIADSSRGWIHKAGNEGFIKLVAADGVLVGATSAGPAGGEVLSMLTLAVHARIPVRRLGEMLYAFPTFHRAVEATLREL
ncbi:pyruvate/2-oxoglutarate dehydrogenase complex dihydrolipoamide dehydrogenase (E3) component [Streptosporangium becharense]|uniref:Pyruvate/2-oxoglutarate dehydrogenase complex dihydrolipoamide dehydrogenase (E3) component n=1 Tax=Streptosporangium becharense TaxID=1816182 RepID=A0A7W9IJV0_9ACTN|nr:NAD(P)/FAD-dependent oxidoreductase [Streptosporangium becharense]MBB2910904.1 pyruvate/2-oxoglutarate dehydrogenase complex dihydrolipoamide dehydrogenase (E3) component [Streptosporangium becharense]MBB5822037.1 pyruvate/2-oxoglutarate dehydrogenase complex dihydrolipoamide dehydrogenase (E3) component [Streptosporangium becharense]